MLRNMAGGWKSAAPTPGARFIALTTIKTVDVASSALPASGAPPAMLGTMPGKSDGWSITAKGIRRMFLIKREIDYERI